MTQITQLPDYLFNVNEPDGYDPEENFSSIARRWHNLPQQHYHNGGVGRRYQVMILAQFFGIGGIVISAKGSEILKDAGFLECTSGAFAMQAQWDLTAEAKRFLYHLVTTQTSDIPQEVRDLEFYKTHKKGAARWIEKQMRKHNGETTGLEKLGEALLALPAAAAAFIAERVKWNGVPQLEWQPETSSVKVTPNLPDVSMPQKVTDADGKTTYVWPALNKGDNLLAAPEAAKAEEEPETVPEKAEEPTEVAPSPEETVKKRPEPRTRQPNISMDDTDAEAEKPAPKPRTRKPRASSTTAEKKPVAPRKPRTSKAKTAAAAKDSAAAKPKKPRAPRKKPAAKDSDS